MRKLRLSRKLAKPTRKQLTINARDIILSIFSVETEAQKLEYSKTNWRSTSTGKKAKIEDSTMKMNYQPLKYLCPFLELIANEVDIDTCNFLFVDGSNLKIVHKERRVTISKSLFSGSKIKYWLSHIYFSRNRKKESDRILTEPKATEREVVHIYQEKEYMPKVIRGVAKGSTTVVRKLTVSNEGTYMRNTDKEKKPFCIVYNKNGSEQQFNFSEILSFVEYTFNMKDIIYIKVLPLNLISNIPISLRYSKSNASEQDIHRIVKFCHIYDQVEGWQFAFQQLQNLKVGMINNKQFESYCELLILEVVAFLKVKKQLDVEIIESEWVMTTARGVILTNVSQFITKEIREKKGNISNGLETLYNKLFTSTPRNLKRSKLQSPFPRSDKRVKSQQKQSINLIQLLNLPLLSTANKTTKSSSRMESPQNTGRKGKNRGRSQALMGIMGLLT